MSTTENCNLLKSIRKEDNRGKNVREGINTTANSGHNREHESMGQAEVAHLIELLKTVKGWESNNNRNSLAGDFQTDKEGGRKNTMTKQHQ